MRLTLLLILSLAVSVHAAEITLPGNPTVTFVDRDELRFYLTPEQMAEFEPMQPPAVSTRNGAPGAFAVASQDLAPAQPIAVQQEWLEPPTGRSSRSLEGVIDTTQYPYSTVCSLFMIFPNGGAGSCSGALIAGERLVLTAGHCIYSREGGGYASQVFVVPGRDGNFQPFGQFAASRIETLQPWIDRYDQYADMAILELGRPTGTGSMGMTSSTGRNDLAGREMTITGYPGATKSGVEQYEDTGNVIESVPQLNIIRACGEPGMSGCPVYLYSLFTNDYAIAANLSAGASGPGQVPPCPGPIWNVGIDQERFRWIQCASLDAGERIPLSFEAANTLIASGQDLTLSIRQPGMITTCAELYVAAEINGLFYYLPSFTTAPEVYSTDVPARVTLLDASIGKVEQILTVNFYAAALHADTGDLVSDGIAQESITLVP